MVLARSRWRVSQEPQLLARARRPAEGRGAERRQVPLEAVLPGRHGEELGDLLGVLALAALAPEELRVAQVARPDLADAAEDPLASLRIVLREPGVEELVDGLREPEQHPARAPRARPSRRFEDARDLGVVQPRDDGPDQDADRPPGPGEGRHRLEAPLRTPRPPLHAAR